MYHQHQTLLPPPHSPVCAEAIFQLIPLCLQFCIPISSPWLQRASCDSRILAKQFPRDGETALQSWAPLLFPLAVPPPGLFHWLQLCFAEFPLDNICNCLHMWTTKTQRAMSSSSELFVTCTDLTTPRCPRFPPRSPSQFQSLMVMVVLGVVPNFTETQRPCQTAVGRGGTGDHAWGQGCWLAGRLGTPSAKVIMPAALQNSWLEGWHRWGQALKSRLWRTWAEAQ